jgi:hypothetical protein
LLVLAPLEARALSLEIAYAGKIGPTTMAMC